jgi:Mn-dependent DtxR family transcriptional regulator
MSRAGTERLVRRTIEIIRMSMDRPVGRQAIADRWGVTPRSVSNVIARARDLFGVVMRHDAGGYTLVDPGVFDTRRLAAHEQRGRVDPTAARKSLSGSGPGGGMNTRGRA